MRLRKIGKDELMDTLRRHEEWLNDVVGRNRAKLSHMDLRGVTLGKLDLTCVDFSYSDLSGADLRWAKLNTTNLRGANLEGAILYGANLCGASLIDANLSNVKYDCTTAFLTLQCPEKGSFIGYKKSDDKIVELRIEEDSLRSSATTTKCRASKVTVLSITSIDGTENFKEVSNTGVHKFTYRVGETYEVEDFDTDRWNECASGIHFFITRDEAVRY